MIKRGKYNIFKTKLDLTGQEQETFKQKLLVFLIKIKIKALIRPIISQDKFQIYKFNLKIGKIDMKYKMQKFQS